MADTEVNPAAEQTAETTENTEQAATENTEQAETENTEQAATENTEGDTGAEQENNGQTETTEVTDEVTKDTEQAAETTEEQTEPTEETTDQSEVSPEQLAETTEGQSEETGDNPGASEEQTEPTEEQTEPTEEQTEPTEEQTEPTEEQTEPTEEQTEPTEPTEEQTEPTEEQTEPIEEQQEGVEGEGETTEVAQEGEGETTEEAHDLAPQDLELTEEQQQKMREVFELYAADGDKIDYRGFKKLVRCFGQNPREEEAQEWYDTADKNNDGSITFNEFCRLFLAHKQPEDVLQEEIRQCLDKIFPQQQEELELSKVIQVMSMLDRQASDLSQADIQRFCEEMDINGNGKIDKAEFVSSLCGSGIAL